MRNIKPLKKPVIASSVSSSGERKAFSFVLLSAGMLSIPAWRGVGCFDDTVQYIAMHIRRDGLSSVPCLFPALFRIIRSAWSHWQGRTDGQHITMGAVRVGFLSRNSSLDKSPFPCILFCFPISHPPDSEHTGRGGGSDCGARDCHGGTATGSRYSERSLQTL